MLPKRIKYLYVQYHERIKQPEFAMSKRVRAQTKSNKNHLRLLSNFIFLFLLVRYTGTLCLVCAATYVKVGDTCEYCPEGASFGAALVPLVVLCVLLYFLVAIVLLRGIKSVGDKKKDNLLQRAKRMQKVNKMFGQGKILMSL